MINNPCVINNCEGDGDGDVGNALGTAPAFFS